MVKYELTWNLNSSKLTPLRRLFQNIVKIKYAEKIYNIPLMLLIYYFRNQVLDRLKDEATPRLFLSPTLIIERGVGMWWCILPPVLKLMLVSWKR